MLRVLGQVTISPRDPVVTKVRIPISRRTRLNYFLTRDLALIGALLVSAAALGCGSSAADKDRPYPPSWMTQPTSITDSLDQDEAEDLSKHVVESKEEILKITDAAMPEVDRLSHTSGKILRFEFMKIAAEVIDQAVRNKRLRQHLTVNSQHRYQYREIAALACIEAAKVAAARK